MFMVVLFTKMRSTYIKQQNGCFVKFYANTKYNYSHTHNKNNKEKWCLYFDKQRSYSSS